MHKHHLSTLIIAVLICCLSGIALAHARAPRTRPFAHQSRLSNHLDRTRARRSHPTFDRNSLRNRLAQIRGSGRNPRSNAYGDPFVLDTGAHYVPCDPSYYQYWQTSATDGHNTLIVWQDDRGSGLFAARIDSAGRLLDSAGIELPSSSSPDMTVVGCDGTNYLVIWDQNGSRLYGARISGAGVLLDTVPFPISSRSVIETYPPSFGAGNYLVTWREINEQGYYPVFAARVTPLGAVLDTGGIPLSSAHVYGGEASVASDGTTWLAAWSQSGDSLLPDGLYGTRIDATGARLDTNLIHLSGNYAGTPSLAFDGTNYLGVWQDGNTGGVSGSRFTPAGVKLDSVELQFPAGSYATGPDVASSPQGSFVIWTNGDWPMSVGGARVTTAGVLLDSTPLVLAESSSVAYYYSTTVVRAGAGFLASWDNDDDSTSYYRVRARRITLSGVVLDTPGITTEYQVYQAIDADAAADSNNLLVTWIDNRSGDYGVYGARVTTAGAILDPDGITISRTTDGLSEPAVAFDGRNYLVAWSQPNSDTAGEIRAARVTPAGTVLDSSAILVLGGVWAPTVTGLAFNGIDYLVVWNGSRNGQGVVGATRITPAGVVLDPGGIAVFDSANTIYGPACTRHDADWFLTWSDDRTGELDVYAARIDSSGTVSPPSGMPLSTTTDNLVSPAAVFDGTNYVAFWYDQSGPGPYSLYLARVTPDMHLLDTNGIRFSPEVDVQYYVVIPDRSSYVIAGEAPGSGGSDIQTFQVGPLGNVLDSAWAVTDPGYQTPCALTRSPDGSLLLTYLGYLGRCNGRDYNTMRIWGKFGTFTGAAEGKPLLADGSRLMAPTIIRGVLSLPAASSPKLQTSSCLLDASGRKVLKLKPGPNDVSRLAPGVYFVREEPKHKRQAQAIRKVILTR